MSVNRKTFVAALVLVVAAALLTFGGVKATEHVRFRRSAEPVTAMVVGTTDLPRRTGADRTQLDVTYEFAGVPHRSEVTMLTSDWIDRGRPRRLEVLVSADDPTDARIGHRSDNWVIFGMGGLMLILGLRQLVRSQRT